MSPCLLSNPVSIDVDTAPFKHTDIFHAVHSNSGGFWFIKQFPTPKSLRVKSSPTKYKIVDRIEKDPLDNEVMKRCDSPTTEEPTEPLYFEPAQAEVVSVPLHSL